MYALNNNVTYFNIFKSIVVTNISRIQAYDSVMFGYFSIKFIDFILAENTLIDFTNLFSPNSFNKNNDITLKYFITNV